MISGRSELEPPGDKTRKKGFAIVRERLSEMRWYFVCERCNAKWFETIQVRRCPRCGVLVVAMEKLILPWRGT